MHVDSLLPSASLPGALDANEHLLAVVFAHEGAWHLRVFAAFGFRTLHDAALPQLPPPHITCVSCVRLSQRGELLGCADESGGLYVWGIRGRSTPKLPLLLRAQLGAPALALAWCAGEQLASGDARGEVRLWPVAAEGACDDAAAASSSGESSLVDAELQRLAVWGDPTRSHTSDGCEGSGFTLLLEADGSPIVQLDCRGASLLASTWVRTMLVPLPPTASDAMPSACAPPRPVGKAKRDGPLGACYLPNLDGSLAVCPSAVIVAARPGRRLWLVDAAGDVLSTLKLPEATESSGSGGGSGGGGGVGTFGKLTPVGALGCLLSWGDGGAGGAADRSAGSAGHICLIDPDRVRVLAVQSLLPPVHSIACLGIVDGGSGNGGQLEVLVLHGAPRQLSRVLLGGVPARPNHSTILPDEPFPPSTPPVEPTTFPPSVPFPSATPAPPPLADETSATTYAAAAVVLSSAAQPSPAACNASGGGGRAYRQAVVVRTIDLLAGDASAASVNATPTKQLASAAGTPSHEGRVRESGGSFDSPAAETPSTPMSWSEGLAIAVDTPERLASAPMTPLLPTSLADLSPSSSADAGVSVVIQMEHFPAAQPAPSPPSVALATSRGVSSLPPRISVWLRGERPASALLALALLGWPRGWRDGLLSDCLKRHAPRLSLLQWTSLLKLAHQMDARRAAAKETRCKSARHAPLPDGSKGADAPTPPLAATPPLGPCATLLVLRGMLGSQPAVVCLGVLRAQPALAERLPPCAYVELLHAVQRATAAAAAAPPVTY